MPRPKLTIDHAVKLVVMLSAIVAIFSFFVTFEPKEDAKAEHTRLDKRITRVEDRAQVQMKEIKTQYIRIDNKLDKLIMKGR